MSDKWNNFTILVPNIQINYFVELSNKCLPTYINLKCKPKKHTQITI